MSATATPRGTHVDEWAALVGATLPDAYERDPASATVGPATLGPATE